MLAALRPRGIACAHARPAAQPRAPAAGRAASRRRVAARVCAPLPSRTLRFAHAAAGQGAGKASGKATRVPKATFEAQLRLNKRLQGCRSPGEVHIVTFTT